MVLFLFVIMLLNLNKETEPHKSIWLKASAAIASGSLLIVLVGSLKNVETIQATGKFNPNIGLIENLGQTLFHEFLLPFEVSSILLLAAMVGAVMLGKKSKYAEECFKGNFIGAAIVVIIYTVYILIKPLPSRSQQALLLVVLNALTIVLMSFAFK